MEKNVYIYFRQLGSGTRVFQISYCVENAVKRYSDVGEFFWNLTGETGISDIGTLTATLIVPEGVPNEDFRIWAYGPLNGTFEKQWDGSAALQVDNVPLGTIVDIRSTLPADCFYGGWEQQGEELFPPHAPQETAEPAQDQEHIPGYQEILWDFLLNAADGSGRIAMKDLKKYIKDNQEAALKFRSSFESAVDREFTERVKSKDVERYSSGGRKRRLIVSAVAGILAMLIRMFSTLYDGVEFGASLKAGLITFVVAVIIQALFHLGVIIVKTPSYVLDQQREDDLALWQAFGRFLDDFTTFEDKELPEFSVWREYMVYAVAMGNGRKVAKALALKYPEAFSTGTDTFDDDMYRWLQDLMTVSKRRSSISSTRIRCAGS